MQSVWAQSILKKFSEVTGYQISQKILHLHRFWPGFRTRWWAVVSHPTLPASDIPDMPDLSFEPGVVHVVPRMLKVEGESLKQLECDLYELRNFHSVRGGVHTCILNMLKPMPTATHSWGSQLRGCLCKCRASGFSSFRLKEHGLYGVLLPLESTVIMNSEEITMLRHLHPQEVALLCGLKPEHVPDHHAIHCRLTLSGVGQLASPLQSAWVLSNFLQNIYPEQIGFVVGTPKSTLTSVVKDLFEARDRLWGIQKPTPTHGNLQSSHSESPERR